MIHAVLIGLRVNFNNIQWFICKIVVPHVVRTVN
jgi:hypothetical protein